MIKNMEIPEERIGVIKSCIKELGKKTKTNVIVEDKKVKIEGKPLDVWKTKDIVKAIGRGFSPQRAFRLLNDEIILYVINLKEYQNTEKGLKRIKGRLIGREGKTREKIEEICDCIVSVHGKTVSIIANSEKISFVEKAIEMLINGSKHNKVYNFLYRCFDDR